MELAGLGMQMEMQMHLVGSAVEVAVETEFLDLQPSLHELERAEVNLDPLSEERKGACQD